MKLTPQESAEAAALGWQLCEVYDLENSKFRLMALPLNFTRRGTHSQSIKAVIVHLAKQGHPLAIKTLTLIAQYNFKKAKK